MVRFLVSLILGAAVTFALFAFMAYLIGGGAKSNEAPPPTPVIDIVTSPPSPTFKSAENTSAAFCRLRLRLAHRSLNQIAIRVV